LWLAPGLGGFEGDFFVLTAALGAALSALAGLALAYPLTVAEGGLRFTYFLCLVFLATVGKGPVSDWAALSALGLEGPLARTVLPNLLWLPAALVPAGFYEAASKGESFPAFVAGRPWLPVCMFALQFANIWGGGSEIFARAVASPQRYALEGAEFFFGAVLAYGLAFLLAPLCLYALAAGLLGELEPIPPQNSS
jgi:hypothetical protein